MGWWPGLAGDFRPLQLDTPCLPLLSCVPWPALGMPQRRPRPQEPLHRDHPGHLCRSGWVGAVWAMRTPAAGLAHVPRVRRGDLGHPSDPVESRLDPEQQWGPFFARAGESPSGGHSPAPRVPPCQLLCLVKGSAVRPGLVQLWAAQLGACGSLRAWLGGGRKCLEPEQGARNVSNALGLCAPPPDPLLLWASPRCLPPPPLSLSR